MTPPKLTDRTRLLKNRANRVDPDALFLHREAMNELKERLIEVNRTFTKPAIVTGHPDLWQELMPQAVMTADQETLDLKPHAHDLVIHAMSLHWANDPIGQIIQCRNALKPDGLFLGVLFGGQTLHELRACLAQAEVAITGGLSPRIAPMGEVRDYGALLQRAQLALPVADTLPIATSYGSMIALMHDLRAMGEGNAMTERRKSFSPKRLFDEAARLYEASYSTDGRIAATFEFVFLTGWAPDESQQKPLRPGSAKTRLADALKVPETKLPKPDKPLKD